MGNGGEVGWGGSGQEGFNQGTEDLAQNSSPSELVSWGQERQQDVF